VNLQNFEELYAPSSSSSVLRGPSTRRLDREHDECEVMPVAWRSILTGAASRPARMSGRRANYYTVAQISVAGVDAANSLMAVKKLVFDDKKLTMPT